MGGDNRSMAESSYGVSWIPHRNVPVIYGAVTYSKKSFIGMFSCATATTSATTSGATTAADSTSSKGTLQTWMPC